jgi:hypothetical protein
MKSAADTIRDRERMRMINSGRPEVLALFSDADGISAALKIAARSQYARALDQAGDARRWMATATGREREQARVSWRWNMAVARGNTWNEAPPPPLP